MLSVGMLIDVVIWKMLSSPLSRRHIGNIRKVTKISDINTGIFEVIAKKLIC
jgi:hypothetical protein